MAVRNGFYTSNTILLSIVYPPPTLTSISPAIVIAGSPNFSMTVTGTGIGSYTNSTVLVNGVSHTPNFIYSNNASALVINIDATEVANVGSLSVTVSNPTPGGGIHHLDALIGQC